MWLMFYLSTIHVMFDAYKNLESLVFEHESYINYVKIFKPILI